MSTEIVKKIDKHFLEHGTREEFRDAILALLEQSQTQAEQLKLFGSRILELENEIRLLKGEKKSLSSSQPKGCLIFRNPHSG